MLVLKIAAGIVLGGFVLFLIIAMLIASNEPKRLVEVMALACEDIDDSTAMCTVTVRNIGEGAIAGATLTLSGSGWSYSGIVSDPILAVGDSSELVIKMSLLGGSNLDEVFHDANGRVISHSYAPHVAGSR